MKPNNTPKFVPLNNVQSEIVEANLALPGAVGLEQLGIDIIRLETLCRIAGISKLTIRNKKSEPEGAVIVGRNKDSTAIGGIVSAKAESSSSQKRTKIPFKALMYTETDIEIDIDELRRRISEKFPEGARSLEGWSRELEEIITKHLGNEGLKFLLSVEKTAMGLDTIMILWAYLFMILTQAQGFIMSPPMIAMIARSLGFIAADRASEEFPGGPNLRFSPLSIVGVEWDRALVLIIMIASTRNLIGKINQDQD